MSHALSPIPSRTIASITANSGVLCMAAAMLLLPVGDTFAKILTGVMSPLEVTLWRLIAQALCLVPVAFVLRRRLRGAMFSPIVALSGLLVVITLVSLIGAFAVMPLATAIAIFFVEPLILTLLAGLLLGEVAGPRRYAAVAVGFAGALIVIRPGFSEFGHATLLPLVAATAYALNMIVLRRACATRSGLTVQCGATVYAAGGMILFMGLSPLAGGTAVSVTGWPVWVWGAILACGAFASASFVLIAAAFRAAEATTLAPLQYLEILGATLAGFLVFGTFPDGLTWLGMAIILGSGAYVIGRDRQRGARVPRRRRGGR